PTPASKILTVAQLHATLATILLVTAASRHPLTDALAYLHLWCAALAFAWWLVLHLSCAGMILGLVGQMVVVGERAVGAGFRHSHSGDMPLGGCGLFGLEGAVEGLTRVVAMAMVAGSVGLLAAVLWPGTRWYMRQLGRVLNWMFPYAVRVVRWML
ncbi:uncharacterized protein THITE_2017121, partial [Thermothielavioides terrestris NRRL 8126]